MGGANEVASKVDRSESVIKLVLLVEQVALVVRIGLIQTHFISETFT